MKKILFFITLISIVLLSFFLLETNENLNDVSLQGKWQPQYTTNSCWKATTKNLNLYQDNLDTTYFFSDLGTLPDKSFQDSILAKNYNFKTPDREGEVLTFNSLKKVLNVDRPRPLIYGYEIESDWQTNGHFVNLIGTKESKTNKVMHSQWIEVYDPWPVNKGNMYLRNYNSYAYRNENRKNKLDKTYFGFQNKKEKSTGQFKDIETIGRKSFLFDSKNKFITENQFDQVNEIIDDSIFKKYIGKHKSFHQKWIPVKEYFAVEKNEKKTLQLRTIERQPKSRILITYDENNQVHGAITLENIKCKQYIIDRVDDFSEYKLLNQILKGNSNSLSLITNNKEDIFLEYRENNLVKYYDFNGKIFKKDAVIPKDSLNKFFSVLKNDKLKITEGVYRYIDAINDLLQNRNCNCYTEAGQYDCEKYKDSIKTAKAYLNKFEISKENFNKSSLTVNNPEQNVTVIARYSKHQHKYFSFYTFSESTLTDSSTNIIFEHFYGKNLTFKHPLEDEIREMSFYFIPISKYKENETFSNTTNKAITPWEIQYISKPYISSNLIDDSESSTSGIIFDVLVNHVIIPCYLVSNNPNYFVWRQ